MNIVVFDTETTNIEKPFCYNIGYVVADTESKTVLLRRDFVVEQVWHNDMLFTTAYYANKREIYVDRMRARKCIMDKFGYITQTMIRDFKAFGIEKAFAYNSPFDKKVFEYNCDWFKCNNPFDDVEIVDIMPFVHSLIAFKSEYQDFCDKYERYTESGNYSTSAETVFQFISGNTDFAEEHTALADSEIEFEILITCIDKYGADINKAYKRYSSIPKKTPKELKVIDIDGNEHNFEYIKKRCYNDGNKIILKNS